MITIYTAHGSICRTETCTSVRPAGERTHGSNERKKTTKTPCIFFLSDPHHVLLSTVQYNSVQWVRVGGGSGTAPTNPTVFRTPRPNGADRATGRLPCSRSLLLVTCVERIKQELCVYIESRAPNNGRNNGMMDRIPGPRISRFSNPDDMEMLRN